MSKTWISFPGPRADNRRLEVVADGLLLFQGAQLAVDTTLVSTVRVDGAPRRQCAERDGAALEQARRTKERTYPELTGEHGRSRLVVLACESGGRWPEETHSQLARARAGSEPVRNELQQEGRGSGGGALFWRVAPLRRSRSLCWSAEEVWGLTERFPRPLTSSGRPSERRLLTHCDFLHPSSAKKSVFDEGCCAALVLAVHPPS